MKKILSALFALLLVVTIAIGQQRAPIPTPPSPEEPVSQPVCVLAPVCECWYDTQTKQDVCVIRLLEICE